MKKNTQLQITLWFITISEPSSNQESTNSVVNKIRYENTEIKTSLKTENKTVQNNMGSKTVHKKSPQVKYMKRTQRYWFHIFQHIEMAS